MYNLDKFGTYTKPAGEDLLSLVKGLSEFKGRVKLHVGEVLNGEFLAPEDVATELDRQILGNYEFFPSNYIALSLIEEQRYKDIWRSHQQESGNHFTRTEYQNFTNRLKQCPEEYRSYFLRMYANPLTNSFSAPE